MGERVGSTTRKGESGESLLSLSLLAGLVCFKNVGASSRTLLAGQLGSRLSTSRK
jgi:hypothetical protein